MGNKAKRVASKPEQAHIDDGEHGRTMTVAFEELTEPMIRVSCWSGHGSVEFTFPINAAVAVEWATFFDRVRTHLSQKADEQGKPNNGA